MAHEITIRADNTAEMAFIGSRTNIWHGLGQELEEGASIEQWKKSAGLDWQVAESKVSYDSGVGSHTFPDRRVLYRSDTQAPLSIVSDSYKIVQPGEVLEFFRDLVQLHNMKLSTAGSLFGGKRFWALAELGKEFSVVDGDKIEGHLLLVTSVDGSLSTQARFVSTRVVCNNTLTIAMSENSKQFVKKSHHTVWDPKEVKIDLGLIDSSWDTYMTNLRRMASVPVSDSFARSYFEKKFYNPEVNADSQGWGAIKKVNELMNLYHSGTGSEFSKGTMWGMMNATTELFTHGSGKRDKSHQFWNSQFGGADDIKTEAYYDFVKIMDSELATV